MHTFKVWAPRARTLEVKIAGQKFPMTRREDDWWLATIADAGSGTDYLFVLDGEERGVPDPRSRWQPHGVHGPSRVFDPSSFAWTDAAWQAPPLSSAIIYELHIGTFTPEGTFAAAESRLEYLRELGISHVELMPVAAFPGERGWGYDGVDLYAPQEAYGGPEGLQHFVNACHAQGLAVLLDVVYNHLGPSGNYLAKFGPYFTHSHHTPWGDAVNLEAAESHEVRRFFIDNALMWLGDYHLDGLRIDAVHAFVDRSAIHFLEQLADEVRELESQRARNLVVIAESDLNDPRLVTAKEAGGFGLDAQWSDDFHHALFTVLTGERQGYYEDFGSLAALAKSLRDVFVYEGGHSRFRRRNHGRPVIGLSGHRFLGYVQNHDQVGNRAKGERLGQLVSLGRAKIAAALVLTSSFVPMLFQGEEFGASAPFQYFTDHDDAELRRQVSEGRKSEFAAFGWSPEEIPDPEAEATFERSKLDWSEVERSPHSELLDWYKQLIHLRRSLKDLEDGELRKVRTLFDEQAHWIVMERGSTRVACNLGAGSLSLKIGDGAKLLLASDASVTLRGSTIELGPDSVAILKVA